MSLREWIQIRWWEFQRTGLKDLLENFGTYVLLGLLVGAAFATEGIDTLLIRSGKRPIWRQIG